MEQNEHKYEEMLSGYIDGTLSHADRAQVDAWLERSEHGRYLLAQMQKLDDMASTSLMEFDDDLLEGLESRIGDAIAALPERSAKKAKITPIWYRSAAIAASVIFVFILGRMMLEDTGKQLLEVEHRSMSPMIIDESIEQDPGYAGQVDSESEIKAAEDSKVEKQVYDMAEPVPVEKPTEGKADDAAGKLPVQKSVGLPAPVAEEALNKREDQRVKKPSGSKATTGEAASFHDESIESIVEAPKIADLEIQESRQDEMAQSIDRAGLDRDDLFRRSILSNHATLEEQYQAAWGESGASASKKSRASVKAGSPSLPITDNLRSGLMPQTESSDKTRLDEIKSSYSDRLAAASQNPFDQLPVYYNHLRQSYDVYRLTGDTTALNFCRKIKSEFGSYVDLLEKQNLVGGSAESYINEIMSFEIAP